jgi:hypothetical protein
LIGGIVLAGAIVFACFNGFLVMAAMRGNPAKDASTGECALKLLVSLAVAAGAVILTEGTALVGPLGIVIYLGVCILTGKRRRYR